MTDVRITTSTSAASPATPDAPDGRPSDQGVFSPATASSEIEADGARVQRFGTSSFPNIADYAFLSDCETNCLIAPSGAVEWFCLPRPDSPSVFT
ncbi:MAG: DUF5911 domain-containing protein, partial [Actinomycetota bacterium]|nr:DUF5911 domain-containing protein [Actinomycetota bacterium]